MNVEFSTIKPEELVADLPPLLSLHQAATILGIGKSKKYELLDVLPSSKLGKEYMIAKLHLAEYAIAQLKVRRGKSGKTG